MAQDTITLRYSDLTDKDRQRFLAKVDNRQECHVWTARIGTNGYGVFSWMGKNRQAHRIAYMIASHQDCPGDKRILHTCDNRACCNPDHLILGTEHDNNVDRYQKERVSTSWCTYELAQSIRDMHEQGKSSWRITKELFGTPVDRSKLNQVLHIINNKTWQSELVTREVL